jgi:LuxR family maltose regulon positive regulatory protein
VRVSSSGARPRARAEAAPPAVPGFAVRRDRLLSLLDRAAQRRLTVVVAPPGYGKTVLVSQWAAARPQRRVRWLTLGPGHDDGERFARDLSGALGSPGHAAGGAALAGLDGGAGVGTAVFAMLRADLDRAPPTTVVLDDFHRLANPVLLDEFGPLVEHLPRRVHVVLVTRVDPPLHHHRLRLADDLVELRQDDLAFRWDEAAELFRRLVGHDLTGAQVDALMARTEGWAVGLQLAAVSLRERADVSRFVDRFAEDDRHVADYLTEQVLRQQPPAIQQFLLSTCVLERMSGPLCDAVTGGTDGVSMLEELDRRSLFITALEPRREWFRYHQLFQALLRHHLRDQGPARERELLRWAAGWHLARDEVETAVDYLAEAGASDEILDAAFTYGPRLAAQGRPATVARWVERVAPPLRQGRGDVLLLHAAASILGGDTRNTGEELAAVDALASTSAERVVADLLRARSALHEGRAAEAVTAADRVLRTAGGVDESQLPNPLGLLGGRQDIRAAAWLTRGVALFHQGHAAAARADLEAALDEGRVMWQVQALGALALLDAWSGRLSSATQVAARALASARELGLDQQDVTAEAHLARASVARRHEDLHEAAVHLEAAAERASRGRDPVLASLLATEQALLALATTGPADGLAVLARVRRPAPVTEPAAVAARRLAVEARLRILIGDLEGAARALDGVGTDGVDVVAARVRLAVERGDARAGRSLVTRWPSEPEPVARLERQLWLAILDHTDGDETLARDRLEAVVAQAEIEGDLGLFRAAGHHVLGPARPLYRARPSPFLREIVHAPGTDGARGPGTGTELVEPLTERESILLALLPTRLSNAEIAGRLGITGNTVKTHVKHIYRKLQVTGRSEAVAAAERMHLI